MDKDLKPMELLKRELARHEQSLGGILEEMADNPWVSFATAWRKQKLETEAMIKIYKHTIKKLKK